MVPLHCRGPLIVTGLACLLAGCATASPMSGPTNAHIWVTDAPVAAAGVDSVVVTLDALELLPADGSSPVPLRIPTGDGFTIDLLALAEGRVALAAAGDLPPGTYDTLRLSVRSAHVVWRAAAGQRPRMQRLSLGSRAVDVPLRLLVTGGDVFDVTIDFDAVTSLQLDRGALSPVVQVASVRQS